MRHRVKSAMPAASQSSRREPTSVDNASDTSRKSKETSDDEVHHTSRLTCITNLL